MNKAILIVMLAMIVMAVGATAWVGEYPTRKAIDCSEVTTGAPAVIGGRDGFLLGGEQQLVWVRCQPGLFLYYDALDNTDYVVGTDLAQVAFEVDEGTGTSYNPTDVWTGYLIVNHMKQHNSTTLLDSSPTGNDLWQGYSYYASALTTDTTGYGIGTIQRSYSNGWGNDGSYLESESPLGLTNDDSVTLQAYNQLAITDGYHEVASIEGPYQEPGPTREGALRFWFTVDSSGGFLGDAIANVYDESTIEDDTNPRLVYMVYEPSSTRVHASDAQNSMALVSEWNPTQTLMDPSCKFYAGATGNNGQWNWDGTLDEMRVYDGVISADQMEEELQNFLGTEGYGTLGVEEVPPVVEESSSSGRTRYIVDASGNVVGVQYGNQVVTTPQPQQAPFLSLTGGQGFDLGGWLKGLWAQLVALFGGN